MASVLPLGGVSDLSFPSLQTAQQVIFDYCCAVSRLKLTYDQIREILEKHGFECIRHQGSSHRRYRGVVNGEVRFVDLSPHNWSEDVGPVMIGMIQRQSGLAKKTFRR